MKTSPNPVDEVKPLICLSPQDKLKSATTQRTKRPHFTTVVPNGSDVKKARRDEKLPTESELDRDGWTSEEYLRAMDFDDRLSQDIEWVDDMDLALTIEDHAPTDDVNDFSFQSSFLRGSVAYDELAEMTSIVVEPVYTPSDRSTTKDAEKLLMSFDTMKFTIPSPMNRHQTTLVSDNARALECQPQQATNLKNAPSLLCTTAAETSKEHTGMHLTTLLTSTTSLLSHRPLATTTRDKKIGSYTPTERKLRLEKFHEKRKNRTWKKSIKYDCRKKLADDRPRIKGRFVRVQENATMCEQGHAMAAGYASPTSLIDSKLSPLMAPVVKTQVPRTASLTLGTTVKPVALSISVPPLSSSNTTSTLACARMIASV
ncbi:hypothetical protein CCR75_003701 [Bremia lactucae]|uniref:CCT domain-containing protein n=1 Tax=Bremia lactucae TaxID=4779 RepID=A0A976IJR0_BRELC|nr:hypothetical protein CCR75_003701 [Bremia lactucae]